MRGRHLRINLFGVADGHLYCQSAWAPMTPLYGLLHHEPTAPFDGVVQRELNPLARFP